MSNEGYFDLTWLEQSFQQVSLLYQNSEPGRQVLECINHLATAVPDYM